LNSNQKRRLKDGEQNLQKNRYTTIYQVALGKEYEDLAKEIERISIDKRQSVSKTIRDMLCDASGFEPDPNNKRNRTKKA
jgi:hypothetical protein